MSRIDYWVSRWPVAIVAALITLAASGCVGMTAQVMYMFGMNDVKPECNDLKGKRVAVVCIANTSAYGSGSEGEALARMVALILRQKVKDIEIISHAEIANWKDNNDWDEIDYRAVGRGVNAEMLVAIDVRSLSYLEGQSLYKGRASYAVTVYDIKNGGTIVFSKDNPDFQFPEHGGRPVTEMAESRFQKSFLTILAQEIALSFHSYEKVTRVAQDATMME